MKLTQAAAAIFGLDDDSWKRHANAWSVWTLVFVSQLWQIDRFVAVYEEGLRRAAATTQS
ncbi:DUF6653 family protein [Nonomuraea pusilla]|uniref:DUF6653 family protein n=1 Tax=Nonomuraea pusilla TaxID=46177 RepID=UPI0033213CCB